ncbi:Cyclin-Q [Amphibalanus amphitrite]|uniref:Cyclin-Q n=1 Tax=Amphibalanus amphitrite TaxID=1232801 RepID=A0A6A4WK93_AMPAM|nr:Cyclin-Q [Amphibalanus amphitrite]
MHKILNVLPPGDTGMKLDAKVMTVASASVLFHRFFREVNTTDYDVYLIAGSCLYLAGKLEDQTLKARDVINVTQATLRPGGRPLDMDEAYWNLRDALVQAELLVLRMLRFNTDFEHPHKYLLHYMVSLEDWLGDVVFHRLPLRRTAWTLLRDSYMDPFILDVKPQWLALACIHVSLQCYGLNVPGSVEGGKTWYETMCPSCSRETLWDVTEKVLDVYGQEQQLFSVPVGSVSSAVYS